MVFAFCWLRPLGNRCRGTDQRLDFVIIKKFEVIIAHAVTLRVTKDVTDRIVMSERTFSRRNERDEKMSDRFSRHLPPLSFFYCAVL
jgi:hypothetical protein